MGLTPTPEDMDIPADFDPNTSPAFYTTHQLNVYFRCSHSLTWNKLKQMVLDWIGMSLFEGRTKRRHLSFDTRRTFRKQSKYHYWVDMLSKKALEVKLINPDKIDLKMLNSACSRINTRTLTKLQERVVSFLKWVIFAAIFTVSCNN